MRGLVTVLLAVITGMFCSFVTYLPFIGNPTRERRVEAVVKGEGERQGPQNRQHD